MKRKILNWSSTAAVAVAAGLLAPSPAQAETVDDPGVSTGADPLPGAIIPIDGYLDTHVHSLARYGYGGRYLHGESDANAVDQSVDLAPCAGNDHGVSWMPGWLMSLLMVNQFERARHTRATFGFSGNANLHFKDWPIFSTTAHEQVHPDFVEDLHNAGTPSQQMLGELDQNLKIFVMSAVNFRGLCSLIRRDFGDIDPDTGAPFDCDDDTNLRRQIDLAWGMSRVGRDGTPNPNGFDWFQVVRSHSEAVQTVASGRLAVVLHLEASELMGSGLADPTLSFQDIDSELSRYHAMGVRSFQPVHEVNNQFAGTAPFDGSASLAALLTVADAFRGFTPREVVAEMVDWTLRAAWRIATFRSPPPYPFPVDINRYRVSRDPDGFNRRGLTERGHYLVRAAMCEDMLVDVAHMSERAFWGTRRASESAYAGGGWQLGLEDDYPLFHSHARFRDIDAESAPPEYYYSDEQISEIEDTGGMLGLRTSNQPVQTVHPSISNSCEGSTRTWVQSYRHGIDTHGLPMGMASDMNSAIAQLRPRFRSLGSKWDDGSWIDGQRYRNWACDGTGAVDLASAAPGDMVGSDYDFIGFGRYDLMDDVMIDAEILGQEVSRMKNESAQGFLDMWERAERSNALHRTPAMNDFCQKSFGNRGTDGEQTWFRDLDITTVADMRTYLEQEASEAAALNSKPFEFAPDANRYDDLNWLLSPLEGPPSQRTPITPAIVEPQVPCSPGSELACAVPMPLDAEFPPAWLVERMESEDDQLPPLEPWQVDELAELQWPEQDLSMLPELDPHDD